MLLLTAQRRDTVASMRWADVAVDGTWSIPSEDRAKGTGGELALPEIAREIIEAQPRFADNPARVRRARRARTCGATAKPKAALDAEGGRFRRLAGCTTLRRTARSLMSRAGVRPDIAERVLGHAIQGVEGVYDRLPLSATRRPTRYARLARLIETILTPTADNVVRITR